MYSPTPSQTGYPERAGLTTYQDSTTLRILKHVAPKPFSTEPGHSPRPAVDWTPWKDVEYWEVDRVELALANPPLETEPPTDPERVLTITGTLTRRQDGGSNVVTCFLDGDSSIQ
jgi:hypothetical protein